MRVIERGHVYEPQNRIEGRESKIIPNQYLTFINKEEGSEHDGTTTQEVIRILIDRTRHCANCMPHRNNEQIVYHLRMALILHEARALERKVEKGYIMPEYIDTDNDGHYDLKEIKTRGEFDTDVLLPHRNDWDRICTHERKSI